MEKLYSMVDECLKQHKGGEKFFDALDDMMRNDTLLITMLLGKVLETKFDYIIVSGNFGKLFRQYVESNMPKVLSEKVIVVPGGLRNGNAITPFWETVNVANKIFVFVDDSFYLGRTRDVIRKSIEGYNGCLSRTFVFYDGSKIKDETVFSFYRYFDEHPEELNNPSFEG